MPLLRRVLVERGLRLNMAKKRKKKRDPVLQVVVTPALRSELEAEAEAAGRTVSGHVRWLLARRAAILGAPAAVTP